MNWIGFLRLGELSKNEASNHPTPIPFILFILVDESGEHRDSERRLSPMDGRSRLGVPGFFTSGIPEKLFHVVADREG